MLIVNNILLIGVHELYIASLLQKTQLKKLSFPEKRRNYFLIRLKIID